MTEPDPSLKETRLAARLAWNNWPDNEAARQKLAEHEARDPFSAVAWDRVIRAIESHRAGDP